MLDGTPQTHPCLERHWCLNLRDHSLCHFFLDILRVKQPSSAGNHGNAAPLTSQPNLNVEDNLALHSRHPRPRNLPPENVEQKFHVEYERSIVVLAILQAISNDEL